MTITLKKGIGWIMGLASGTLFGSGGVVIWLYFSASKYVRPTNTLVLGIVLLLMGVVLFIISYRSDA